MMLLMDETVCDIPILQLQYCSHFYFFYIYYVKIFIYILMSDLGILAVDHDVIAWYLPPHTSLYHVVLYYHVVLCLSGIIIM